MGILARAKEEATKPIRWPLSGRYLLAALAFTLMIRDLDVARIRFEPRAIEGILGSGPSTPTVAWLRTIPIPFLAWVAWRIYRHGLTHDPPEESIRSWASRLKRRVLG